MNLHESSLLHSISSARRYNALDIADLCFLYMITLHILRCEFEFAPMARAYAHKTLGSGDFSHVHIHNTDLYQLLNILLAQNVLWTQELKNAEASSTFLSDIYLNQSDVIKFLRNIQQGGFNPDMSSRLLLKMENQLRISVTNYKSVRRIASDWTEAHVDKHAKALVVTRLLQALRHKAFSGDLRIQLEKLAHKQDLEYKDACDQETGKNCTITPTPVVKQKSSSLLKQLAVGAGLGVGAYLLGKAMFGPKERR